MTKRVKRATSLTLPHPVAYNAIQRNSSHSADEGATSSSGEDSLFDRKRITYQQWLAFVSSENGIAPNVASMPATNPKSSSSEDFDCVRMLQNDQFLMARNYSRWIAMTIQMATMGMQFVRHLRIETHSMPPPPKQSANEAFANGRERSQYNSNSQSSHNIAR